ncbi:MAG TPA: hypothetical protein VMG38_19480 [Trebonia sp.]|nr:hypothetical protein [Trebonia sp.]
MLAVHEELPRQRVMVAVEELRTRGACGVLEVTGIPSGAIYLEGGRITFAKASWVPGPAARLRSVQPLPAELTELLASRGGQDDAAIAAHIAQRGYLTLAGLHRLIHSIVVDVLLVLTIPLATDSPDTAIRFASTRGYWPEAFPRLDVGSVRAEAIRRAQRMAQCDLAPTTAVALHWLRLPAAVLTSEEWAIARQLTGPASAQELALRSGIALADTMECLGGLMRAGLCAPVRIPGQRRLPPLVPQAAQVAPSAPPPMACAPVPAAAAGPGPAALDRRDRSPVTAAVSQPVPLTILRQVLDGLRKL